MKKSISAVYENGFLRPLKPLNLAERQLVSLTIDESVVAVADDHDLLDEELLTSLAGEDLRAVSLEEVWAVMAKIPGSMTASFISEREERF
ncbi:MAG: antitoxin family protein [Bryobacteraceae bacterium]